MAARLIALMLLLEPCLYAQFKFDVLVKTGDTVDGQVVQSVGWPSLSITKVPWTANFEIQSFAYAAQSSSLGQFIVRDGVVCAKPGDVFDGVEIAVASQPAMSGTSFAFMALRSSDNKQVLIKDGRVAAKPGDVLYDGHTLTKPSQPTLCGSSLAFF